MRLRDQAESFWEKVDRHGPTPGHRPELGPCWVWTAYRTASGYGEFRCGGWRGLAHRWAYERACGAIPAGLDLDHLCRTRACVRPEHLEPVTHVENLRRAEAATGSAAAHGRKRAEAGVLPPAVAYQRAKTRCPAGHPYDAANTRISKSGRRCCRACARLRWHRTKRPDSGSIVAMPVLFLEGGR